MLQLVFSIVTFGDVEWLMHKFIYVLPQRQEMKSVFLFYQVLAVGREVVYLDFLLTYEIELYQCFKITISIVKNCFKRIY